MTTKALLANAKNLTVVNDGQSRYAVETVEMTKWIAAHGKITRANYQDFCDAVEAVVPSGLHIDSPDYHRVLERAEKQGARYANLS